MWCQIYWIVDECYWCPTWTTTTTTTTALKRVEKPRGERNKYHRAVIGDKCCLETLLWLRRTITAAHLNITKQHLQPLNGCISKSTQDASGWTTFITQSAEFVLCSVFLSGPWSLGLRKREREIKSWFEGVKLLPFPVWTEPGSSGLWLWTAWSACWPDVWAPWWYLELGIVWEEEVEGQR